MSIKIEMLTIYGLLSSQQQPGFAVVRSLSKERSLII